MTPPEGNEEEEVPKSNPASAGPAIRAALAGLLVAASIAGCSGSGSGSDSSATSSASSGASASPAATSSAPVTSAAPTGTQLQPPAAPTDLNEWAVPFVDGTGASEEFSWTAPDGTISGYYFSTSATYANGTPPPAKCGPSWQVIPASADTFEIASVATDPEAFICAFNAAGTSATVKFMMQPYASDSPAS
jgi:hypothetical protein